MGSFGERMRREREMRGITLEEISEATKITSRCLQALEDEEFNKLPGGIFNKGFVRSYASYVGIDEEQAVAEFVVASGGEKDQPLPDPPEPRAVTLGQRRAEDHPNWRAIGVLAVVVVAAVAVVWKLGPAVVHLVAERMEHSNRAPAATSSAAPPEVASVGTPSVPSVQEAAPTPPPPVEAKKSVAKAKQVAVAASTPAPAPPTPRPAAPPAPARSADFVVQIRATEDAWVQIVADGKLFSEGVLVPPAEKRVRAAKAVVIKTGNAAGVEVSFNGQPLQPLGEENQMATVTLTPAGVKR